MSLKNHSLNGTNLDEADHCDDCFGIFVVTICFKIFVFLVQFIGNSLIVWTVVSTASLHSTCMMLICNLAIADFLIGVLVVPTGVAMELHAMQHKFPLWLWKICMIFAYTFCAASMMNLVAMSIDRCMMIIKPLKYKVFMTPRKVKTVIFITWLLSILTGLLEGFHLFTRRVCFLLTLSCVVVVYLVILVSYGIILSQVRKQKKIRAQMAPALQYSNNQFPQRASDQKLTKTVGIVIGIFSLCWSLFGYTMLTPPEKFNAEVFHTTWGHVYMWGTSIAFTSTAFNPVIYFYRTSSLRNAAKTLLNKKLIQKWCI